MNNLRKGKMVRDSAFPYGFNPTLENLIELGRDKLIRMQNDLAYRISNLSRIWPEGSARQSSYEAEIRMIESALKVLDERENVVYNKRILTNSREDIAEMLYTSEIDAVKYRSDEGQPDHLQSQSSLERLNQAERLAKELAEIGYPITDEEMMEAKDRIKDRTIRAGRARRMDRMSVCNRCRSSIFAESVYCSHCGDLVGKAPTRSVFVSYGSQDGQFVESIINSLRKRNISAWFDEWELLPGMSIQDEINKAIDRSKIFLFFASSSTLVKKWPKEELKAALNRRMNAANDLIIIPILLDECQNQLPTLLKDTKYLVFYDGKERINIETENGKKVLDSLEKAILHLGKEKVLAG